MKKSVSLIVVVAVLTFSSLLPGYEWTHKEDIILLETIQEACFNGETGVFSYGDKEVPLYWFTFMYSRYGDIHPSLRATATECYTRYKKLRPKFRKEAHYLWEYHKERVQNFDFLLFQKPKPASKKRSARSIPLPAVAASEAAVSEAVVNIFQLCHDNAILVEQVEKESSKRRRSRRTPLDD